MKGFHYLIKPVELTGAQKTCRSQVGSVDAAQTDALLTALPLR